MLYIVSLGAMIFDSLLSSSEFHHVTREIARVRLWYGPTITGSVENSDLVYAVESQRSCRFPLVYTIRRKSPSLGGITLPPYVWHVGMCVMVLGSHFQSTGCCTPPRALRVWSLFILGRTESVPNQTSYIRG